jgi:hypothetical protein
MAPHPDSDSKSKRRKLKLRVFMKSTKFKIPGKYDMPIRVRLWFILFTCVIMIILALLGFTNSSKAWIPLNHKVLRFTCFTLATGVMYFVVDVDEDARRVWYWRNCSLLFVLFVCFFCGGIVSEFVQAMLITTKEFKMGDIIVCSSKTTFLSCRVLRTICEGQSSWLDCRPRHILSPREILPTQTRNRSSLSACCPREPWLRFRGIYGRR